MSRRIAIDCRFGGLHAGIGIFTRNIVSALLELGTGDTYVLLVRSADESWLQNLSGAHEVSVVDLPYYSLREQRVLPSLLRSLKIDLLYCPHFAAPVFSSVPFAITVHDLILHTYPGDASLAKRWGYRILLRMALARAKTVVAVTNYVKQEIDSYYGANIASKTIVSGEGTGLAFTPRSNAEQHTARQTYGLKKDFFLYVGNAKVHKNVPLLIDAFVQSGTDAELVLVMSQKEAKTLGMLPSSVRVVSDVDDDTLAALYSAATAFVTTSKAEGFCLPLAEALACGCPAIVPNDGPFPEVAKGNAMLVERTPDAFIHALRHPPTLNTPCLDWSWNEAAEHVEASFRRS